MLLCFVDESGTPAKPGADRPRYFVIAGLIVPEERWHKVSAQLHGLKTRWAYRGELKWRYFSPSNTDDDNPMVGWDQDRKNALRADAFRIITGDKSIKIVAGVCDAALAYELPDVADQSDIYFGTYKVVTERFQYYLQDLKRESGTTFRGIIVADHRGRDDDKTFRLQHQRLVFHDGPNTSNYSLLVEGLFLAPSHMSVGVQLADLVAGAIWRRFDADDRRWFDVIKENLRTSSAGAIDGYGIARFPRRGWTGPVE
jgi:hypothetical protein